MEPSTDIHILRRRPDGEIEIRPPRVSAAAPMPEVIAEGNELRRRLADKRGTPIARVYAVDYPVEGGWGYAREEPCIVKIPIKRRSSDGLPDTSDAVSFEYLFAERRIYEEIIIHPEPSTPDLHNLRWNLVGQRTHHSEEYLFLDELTVDVSGFLREDFEKLKEDWESHGGYQNDPEGRKRHLDWAGSKKISYRAEYWFAIADA